MTCLYFLNSCLNVRSVRSDFILCQAPAPHQLQIYNFGQILSLLLLTAQQFDSMSQQSSLDYNHRCYSCVSTSQFGCYHALQDDLGSGPIWLLKKVFEDACFRQFGKQIFWKFSLLHVGYDFLANLTLDELTHRLTNLLSALQITFYSALRKLERPRKSKLLVRVGAFLIF